MLNPKDGSYNLGVKKGLFISLVSVILQFISGRMYLSTGIGGFMLDYVIGYGAYGIAALFPNYKYFYSGVLISNLIRLLASTISGVVYYKTTWLGSLGYNSTYMIPTMIIAMILTPLIEKRLKIM